MATASTTIKPVANSKETILGLITTLEDRYGCLPRNDLSTTLNTKFGIFGSKLPAARPFIQYFCWGVGGSMADSTGLLSAQYVSGLNMALYNMRPFRAVPFEEDLSALERANYALRVVTTVGGVQYCLYYAKKIDFTDSQVQLVRTDPVSGVVTNYEIDPTNLTAPVPPAADSNGVVQDVADQVSVVLPGQLIITGQEVLESASVMDGGDMRYARASEVGMIRASAEQVSLADFTGQPFSYTEAIMAQLVNMYDWTGQPFLSTADSFTKQVSYTMRSLIVT